MQGFPLWIMKLHPHLGFAEGREGSWHVPAKLLLVTCPRAQLCWLTPLHWFGTGVTLKGKRPPHTDSALEAEAPWDNPLFRHSTVPANSGNGVYYMDHYLLKAGLGPKRYRWKCLFFFMDLFQTQALGPNIHPLTSRFPKKKNSLQQFYKTQLFRKLR